MVDRKIPGSIRPAESAGFFLPPEYDVLLAGSSPKRLNYLRGLLPDREIRIFQTESEPIAEPTDVVHFKLDSVLRNLGNAPGQGFVLAADCQIGIPSKLGYSLKTKPGCVEDVRRNFEEIMESEKTPNYIITAASGVHNLQTQVRNLSVQVSKINLDPEAVVEFSTTEGIEAYLNCFNEHYSSQEHLSTGLPTFGVADVSSGLSLPILTKIGAVTEIDGESVDSPNFETAYMRAVHIAWVGIDPGLLFYRSLLDC